MSNVSGTTASSQVLQGLTQRDSSTATAADQLGDRFLTLLVTQMQNQDPLNPMDNAELTSQLAQINTVKGVDQLNTTLQKLLTSYSDALSMQSSSLIGKSVLTAGGNMALGQNGAIGGINLEADADVVNIVIKDSTGKEVAAESLGPQKAGIVDFVWDGKDSQDKPLPAGNYSFSVQATKGTEKVKASTLQVGTVSALVKGSNGFQLEIPGTGLVDFSAVQQIY